MATSLGQQLEGPSCSLTTTSGILRNRNDAQPKSQAACTPRAGPAACTCVHLSGAVRMPVRFRIPSAVIKI